MAAKTNFSQAANPTSFAVGLPHVFAYLDDILVASESREQHLADVRAVLVRLQENGLVINPTKSEFCKTSVTYLGHKVTSSGISPLEKNTDALLQFPPPTNRRELQRFLGMINFYRRFVKNAAGVLQPLTDALCGKPTAKLVWSAACEEAFLAAKKMLAEAVELHHPVPGAPVALSVDASGSHVGAVLSQQVQGKQQPLAFFSSKLNSAQQKYSAFDRELLAAFLAVRHFRFQLEGRPFLLYTDHKPLVTAINRKSPPLLARQARHLSFLSEFAATFVHLPGKDNVTADTLSRPPNITAIATMPPPCPLVDFEELAKEQLVCPSIKKMLSCGRLHVQPFPLPGGSQLLCDVSASVPRPLVPIKFTFPVFEAIHKLAHPGTRATLRLVSAKFVWQSMKVELRRWCQQCVGCQRGKVTKHTKKQLTKIPIPEVPFSTVHIDLVGPLPMCEGNRYLFTIIDRTTRWPEAVPVKDMAAATCAAAFASQWVSRFGTPTVVVSDRGPQFCSSVWRAFCELIGVKQNLTSAYHPQSNGLVERFHRRLKDALRAKQVGDHWVTHLPWVMLGLRTQPREESGRSAAQTALGTSLFLPGQFFSEQGFGDCLRRQLEGLPPVPVQHNREQAAKQNKELFKADFVFIRNDSAAVPPLALRYHGPYKVINKKTEYFVVELGDAVDSIALDRLKPAVLPEGAVAVKPPQRGRPPKSSNVQDKIVASPPRRGRPRKKRC